jgi:hypothetical protein
VPPRYLSSRDREIDRASGPPGLKAILKVARGFYFFERIFGLLALTLLDAYAAHAVTSRGGP